MLPDSDGSGIFFIGSQKSNAYIRQIWLQPYPAGEILRIANDLSEYSHVSTSGDGSTLVTEQRRKASGVYVGDSPANLRRGIDWNLHSISTEQTAGHVLSWTGTGKLAQIDQWNHFDLTSSDGANRVRLLGSDSTVWEASGCGLGDQMAISRVSDIDENNIWQFNVATGELKQITSGKQDFNPSCTPDGNWVVYESWDRPEGGGEIFKIPVGGGPSVRLAGGAVYMSRSAISSDGQSFAYLRIEGEGKQMKGLFMVQKLNEEAPSLKIEAPRGYESGSVGWTPDGNARSYLRDEDDGTKDLWMQPILGGPPVRLMHFDSEPSLIVAYAWSHDGRKIAITRARLYDTDVVEFSGYR